MCSTSSFVRVQSQKYGFFFTAQLQETLSLVYLQLNEYAYHVFHSSPQTIYCPWHSKHVDDKSVLQIQIHQQKQHLLTPSLWWLPLKIWGSWYVMCGRVQRILVFFLWVIFSFLIFRGRPDGFIGTKVSRLHQSFTHHKLTLKWRLADILVPPSFAYKTTQWRRSKL